MNRDDFLEELRRNNLNKDAEIVRSLNKGDIEQIALARLHQEVENGNGATEEYIEEYKKNYKRVI